MGVQRVRRPPAARAGSSSTRCSRALDEFVGRHEVLRTTYPVLDGRPVQVVGLAGPFELTRRRSEPLAHRDAEAEARRLASRRGPATLRPRRTGRCSAACSSGSRTPRTMCSRSTMHHIATDAWSEAVLLDELERPLQRRSCATATVPARRRCPIQYADFAVWQRERMPGDHLEAQLDYWVDAARRRCRRRWSCPADRPAARRALGARRAPSTSRSGPALTAGLRRVAARRARDDLHDVARGVPGRCSPATAARTTSPSAPPSRTARGARPRGSSASSRTPSCCGPTSPATRPSSRCSPRCARSRSVPTSHQDAAVRAAGEGAAHRSARSVTPRCSNTCSCSRTRPAWRSRPRRCRRRRACPSISSTAMFDLTLVLSESRRRVWSGRSSTPPISTTAPPRSGSSRHFERLLEAIVAEPGPPDRAQLDLLATGRAPPLLVEWNDTGARRSPARCIHEMFEPGRARARTPSRLTAPTTSRHVPRSRRARQPPRRRLRRPRCRTGPPVSASACRARPTRSSPCSATLKAGGAYVPLDPGLPAARLRFMIEDAHVDIVITSRCAGRPARRGSSRPIGVRRRGPERCPTWRRRRTWTLT